MKTDERINRLAAIDAATNYEDEQKLIVGMPGVDVRHDLPGDAGTLWRLHHHDMDNEDLAEYQAICQKLELPFERGVKMYYVTLQTIRQATEALTGAGFMVALNFDAATARPDIEETA